jgi:hypothetical protein
MAKVFLVNDDTGARIEVLSYDKERNELTLLGDARVPWVEPFDKEKFKALGFRRVVEPVQETEDA